jgi:hypothetical protein
VVLVVVAAQVDGLHQDVLIATHLQHRGETQHSNSESMETTTDTPITLTVITGSLRTYLVPRLQSKFHSRGLGAEPGYYAMRALKYQERNL